MMPPHGTTSRIQPFLHRSFHLLALLAGLWPHGAWSQTFHYEVELDVPAHLRTLLHDNLDIFKWTESPEANLDFLRRLFQRAPEQIRSLLATEGYFSPQIKSGLREEAGTWIARFEIVPC